MTTTSQDGATCYSMLHLASTKHKINIMSDPKHYRMFIKIYKFHGTKIIREEHGHKRKNVITLNSYILPCLSEMKRNKNLDGENIQTVAFLMN